MKKCGLVSVIAAIAAMVLPPATLVFAEKSGSPIVPKKKIVLFNGKDFTGWKLFVEEPSFDLSKNWKVKNGIVMCNGRPSGYMRTVKPYAGYKFHVEWKWVQKPGNSGVLVHMSGPDKVWPKSIECQMLSGDAGDFYVIEGTEFKQHADGSKRVDDRRVKKLHDSSEKPLGQWNTYEVICKDNWIVALINGQVQNVATGCNVTGGKICLQSEGAPVMFRNIYLEPVE